MLFFHVMLWLVSSLVIKMVDLCVFCQQVLSGCFQTIICLPLY
ncbi:unnamed protein product [Brassica oleracea]|uniref:(rape) hypothetical protein n=1 Tax=Brassica napus TaxID=3708 RepID=A0A816K5J7_BRANA|nr:unnamed protein product [Brassica napus]